MGQCIEAGDVLRALRVLRHRYLDFRPAPPNHVSEGALRKWCQVSGETVGTSAIGGELFMRLQDSYQNRGASYLHEGPIVYYHFIKLQAVALLLDDDLSDQVRNP